MEELLADTSKLALLSEDAVKITLQWENQVKMLFKKLKTSTAINEGTYDELHLKDSRIAIQNMDSRKFTNRMPLSLANPFFC